MNDWHTTQYKRRKKKQWNFGCDLEFLSELTIAHLVTVAAVFKMFKRFKWNRKKKFVIFVRHFFRRIKINSSFTFHRNMWHCFCFVYFSRFTTFRECMWPKLTWRPLSLFSVYLLRSTFHYAISMHSIRFLSGARNERSWFNYLYSKSARLEFFQTKLKVCHVSQSTDQLVYSNKTSYQS